MCCEVRKDASSKNLVCDDTQDLLCSAKARCQKHGFIRMEPHRNPLIIHQIQSSAGCRVWVRSEVAIKGNGATEEAIEETLNDVWLMQILVGRSKMFWPIVLTSSDYYCALRPTTKGKNIRWTTHGTEQGNPCPSQWQAHDRGARHGRWRS